VLDPRLHQLSPGRGRANYGAESTGAALLRRGSRGWKPPGLIRYKANETWHALDLLAHDRMQDLQALADEAFRDLLAKHGRPADLKTALRWSAGVAVEKKPAGKRRAKP
jgi:hypothetical protein